MTDAQQAAEASGEANAAKGMAGSQEKAAEEKQPRLKGFPTGDTLADRTARYEFSIQRCAYVGAGYGGVFLLAGLAGDRVFRNTASWVTPLLAGVLTLGVVLLGWSYLRFGSALRTMRVKHTVYLYPKAAYWAYVASLPILLIATVIVFAAMLGLFPLHSAPTPHPASSIPWPVGRLITARLRI